MGVGIHDFRGWSICALESGDEPLCHSAVAALRLRGDNNCGEELPPLVEDTREELHGALAIAIDLLENL